jgi:hypothetical protein
MASRPPASNATATGQQVNSTVFDCSQRSVGIYGNPKQACDTKFYICVDSTTLAYEQPCPARLYFDGEEKICDSWIHIPACSGKSRPPTSSTKAPTNVSMSTAAPIVDCKNKTDGSYPDPIGESKPFCSNRFYVCIGGISIPFKCPDGLFYDNETDQCDRENRVPACSGQQSNGTEIPFTNPPPVTLPKVNFDCRNRQDGYYANKCSNEFFSCNGGQARSLNCPADLIFDPDTKRCDVPSNTMICTGSSKAPTTRGPSTVPSNITSSTASPMKCENITDGIYPDPTLKCSHHFYFCAHNVPFQGVCPANLFYDASIKKCDLWLNVFDCSGLTPTSPHVTSRTPPPVFPTVDFDCTHSDDGNFVNPKNKCSKFFYMCASMEAFQQYCPASLYYDPDRDLCDSWQHVFACSGKTEKPSTVRPSTASLLSTEKPILDCSKLEGIYENPTNKCSHIYYQCVGGHLYTSECPSNLYFDIELDRCDLFEYVPACSHITHTPSKPSTKAQSPTSPPSTVKPVLDCMVMDDGDYADPSKKCSSTYITCASGFTFVRDCSKGTFYDSDSDRCDTFNNVAACTGKPRISTTMGPSTERTERPRK